MATRTILPFPSAAPAEKKAAEVCRFQVNSIELVTDEKTKKVFVHSTYQYQVGDATPVQKEESFGIDRVARVAVVANAIVNTPEFQEALSRLSLRQ